MSEKATEIPLIDTNLFITVSGPPGCGATTLCSRLSESMDCPYVSGGDIFREIAENRDMTLTQLGAKAQESDEIDRALDRRLREIAEEWGMANKPFILESRLAGRLAGDRADLRIYLDAPEEVRKKRIENREETSAEMGVREVGEAGRYQSYYEIDVGDLEFYDLHLNTARWSQRGVFELVRTAIEEYDPGVDEGAFETEALEIDQ
ncbi:AAA family ATPase [Haloarcula sp. S1AR25-5A]|uniref:Cytidylate kinase n=1 Tax=Haloarcula terrestris TaxID=2950533 RepID=A0AAE4JGP5_9EURY|nr:AAA family ATPase [Haloarcula terrestris]MDS0221673.1 AAA family ATPase [Haloarcula terrestris]